MMEAPVICDFIPMFHDYTRTLLGNLIELSKAIGLAMQRMRHEGICWG